MADYLPPPGPPPPKVPEGWKAQWSDQYKEWFYINIYTKQSQWEKPIEPIYPPPAHDGTPSGPPPGYSGGSGAAPTDYKTNPYESGNRGPGMGNSSTSVDDDARLAARLQAEEDARARSRGANADYPTTSVPQTFGGSPQQELPPRDGKRGLFSKLLGKSNSSSQPQYQQQYHQQYPQQGYAGGYPQQGYAGYPPQQAYNAYPQQSYGGYASPAPAQQKSSGIGAMGGAALGLGGGLIGGMLLEDAIEDHDQNEYQQGYDQGQDNGDYGDGDMGGGDF